MVFDTSEINKQEERITILQQKLSTYTGLLSAQTGQLHKIKDVVVSHPKRTTVQVEVNGEKIWEDDKKTIPRVTVIHTPEVTEPPMEVDGKHMTDTKRNAALTFIKSKIDELETKILLLETQT